MKAISYTSVRGNLAKTMKNVCDTHDPVIITRNKSESVVMLSLEDYESLNETNYLLQSPVNARRLLDSVNEFSQGMGKERELIE
jgi:antitoxin YefM